MEAMRQSWTDERLDDFRGEVRERFAQVDQRFDRIDDRFDQVNERFDSLYRLMLQLGGLVFAALIGLLATQV
jgi:hypothetical protein